MTQTLATPPVDSTVLQQRKERFATLRTEARELSELKQEAYQHNFQPHSDLKRQIDEKNRELVTARRELNEARLKMLLSRRDIALSVLRLLEQDIAATRRALASGTV